MPTTKLIPGFAKSMAKKFMISCEHIAYMMEQNNIEVFKADLVDVTISQPELDIERNRILVGYVSNNLKNLMGKYPDIEITKAELTFVCDAEKEETTVFIASDTGKSWSGSVAY